MRDGVHPPGGRLPTEADLCRRFEVSRATVRSALKELDVLGLVHTRTAWGPSCTAGRRCATAWSG